MFIPATGCPYDVLLISNQSHKALDTISKVVGGKVFVDSISDPGITTVWCNEYECFTAATALIRAGSEFTYRFMVYKG